jgi:hypothetical protein
MMTSNGRNSEHVGCIEEEEDARAAEVLSLTPEMTAFASAIAVVLGWAFFVTLLYVCCLKDRLDGAPALGAQFFAVSGIFQLLATAVVIVVFVPQCGTETTICCPYHTQQWQYYAGSASLSVIGLMWLSIACNRSSLAHKLSNGEVGGALGTEGGIFSKIPSEAADGDMDDDLEMTERSDTATEEADDDDDDEP